MRMGGESTGVGGTSEAGMRLMMSRAHTQQWEVVNWMFTGQSQTPQEVSDAFQNAAR